MKNQRKKIQYPFKTNIYFSNGDQIRQVNIVQNNYKNIYNYKHEQSFKSINNTTNNIDNK